MDRRRRAGRDGQEETRFGRRDEKQEMELNFCRFQTNHLWSSVINTFPVFVLKCHSNVMKLKRHRHTCRGAMTTIS